MGVGIYTEDEAIEYCASAAERMERLFGEAPDEAELRAWVRTAQVGSMHDYRIGIWVRLRDE